MGLEHMACFDVDMMGLDHMACINVDIMGLEHMACFNADHMWAEKVGPAQLTGLCFLWQDKVDLSTSDIAAVIGNVLSRNKESD